MTKGREDETPSKREGNRVKGRVNEWAGEEACERAKGQEDERLKGMRSKRHRCDE